jgi:type II secretion system protein H
MEKEQAGPSSLKLLRMTTHGGVVAKQQRGVTLLELIVVVALASVLLGVVFPSVGAGLRTLELRSAAERVAASARYARDQAVHRQRFYELEIDAEAGTVTVTDFSGESRRSFELPATVRVERILPDEDAFPRARARAERPRRFLFSPDGNTPAFEIVLGNERRQAAVRSNPLTGFPKVEEL